MERKGYDPTKVSSYFGASFRTETGFQFSIDYEGRVRGRESIEGARVDLIAGVESADYWKARSCFNKPITRERKNQLDGIIFEQGYVPKKGLHLALSLVPEDVDRKNRIGLLTAKIFNINRG